MTTDMRAFATRLAGSTLQPEDRAWTCHHRPGQLTVSDYRRLDEADASEVAGVARVSTTQASRTFEYLALDTGGWLIRVRLDVRRYDTKALQREWARYAALPYLRVVDDASGYSLPDPLASLARPAGGRAKVVDVPSSDAPDAPQSARPAPAGTRPPPVPAEEEGPPCPCPRSSPTTTPTRSTARSAPTSAASACPASAPR